MTIGKISSVTLGVASAFALGVWTGPHIVDRAQAPSSIESWVDGAGVPPAEPVVAEEVTAAARTSTARAARTKVAATAPELQARLRTVLNRGANMELAAQGFGDGEQFATVAHAARNTKVPFVLLKHRVLNEGKSVAAAIRDSKPAVNAMVEAGLARAQAKADIATIAG